MLYARSRESGSSAARYSSGRERRKTCARGAGAAHMHTPIHSPRSRCLCVYARVDGGEPAAAAALSERVVVEVFPGAAAAASERERESE